MTVRLGVLDIEVNHVREHRQPGRGTGASPRRDPRPSAAGAGADREREARRERVSS